MSERDLNPQYEASPDPQDSLQYLTQRGLALIDELTDQVVVHATAEQSSKILHALGQRCKILADRLDARSIRSREFKL